MNTFILTNLHAITGDECYQHRCQFHVSFMRRGRYERHGGHVGIPVFLIPVLFVAILCLYSDYACHVYDVLKQVEYYHKQLV